MSQPQRNLPKTILRNLLFMDEPAAALLLALGLGTLCLPLGLWLLTYQLQGKAFERLWTLLEQLLWLLPYWFALWCVALNALLRPVIATKAGRLVTAACCAILPLPVPMAMLLAAAVKMRRWIVAGLLTIYLLAEAGTFLAPGNTQINYNYIYCFKIVILLLTCFALAARPFRPTFRMILALMPFALLAWVCWQWHVENHRMDAEIALDRQAVAVLVGHPMELSDYRGRVESGFSLEDEPLKSLIASCQQIEKAPIRSLRADTSPEDVHALYEQYVAANGEFVQHLEAWLRLPMQPIAHPWSDSSVASILLPELQGFRDGAAFLTLKLRTHVAAPEVIRQCNRSLELLRDELLCGEFLISAMVGCRIEKMRIATLATTLACRRWTCEEWQELLGPEPDWSVLATQSLANELNAYDSYAELLWDNPLSYYQLMGGEPPFHARLWKASGPGRTIIRYIGHHDRHFATHYFRKLAEWCHTTPHSHEQLLRLQEEIHEGSRQRFALLSSALLPTLTIAPTKFDEAHDLRRLAELAWKIMEYRHDHDGQLPETLDFLDEIPASSVTGKPFDYMVGEVVDETSDAPQAVNGFRLTATTFDYNLRNLRTEKPLHLIVPLKYAAE